MLRGEISRNERCKNMEIWRIWPVNWPPRRRWEIIVEYSLHQPVARGGYCCMSLFGVLEKKSITEILHHFHVLMYMKFEKWICNFEISINSLLRICLAAYRIFLPASPFGRTFSSKKGAVAGELAIQSQLFASTFEACETWGRFGERSF